jgi:5'-3' exonuclease
MKWQLVTLIQMLECLPVTIFALDNVEADDVIAYLSQIVTQEGGDSIIYSTDKDFFQLAASNVKIYNPVKKKTFSEDVILEDYGIHPKHFHFFRALDGDKSDNIDGIKGVGEASVRKYIPEITDPTSVISVDMLVQKYANQKKVPKIIQSILNNRDVVERNLHLMNLHEGIMSNDARMKVVNMFHKHVPELRRHELTSLMMRNRLLPSIPNYTSWISQAFTQLTRFKNDDTV